MYIYICMYVCIYIYDIGIFRIKNKDAIQLSNHDNHDISSGLYKCFQRLSAVGWSKSHSLTIVHLNFTVNRALFPISPVPVQDMAHYVPHLKKECSMSLSNNANTSTKERMSHGFPRWKRGSEKFWHPFRQGFLAHILIYLYLFSCELLNISLHWSYALPLGLVKSSSRAVLHLGCHCAERVDPQGVQVSPTGTISS